MLLSDDGEGVRKMQNAKGRSDDYYTWLPSLCLAGGGGGVNITKALPQTTSTNKFQVGIEKLIMEG